MRPLLRAIGAVSLLTSAAALAADHREAPTISQNPTADINDVYVFRAPNARSRLVLAMTVNPLSEPEFASSYAFNPAVLYRFSIDNTGDAVFEHNIDITFSRLSGGEQTLTAVFPDGTTVEGLTTRPTVLSARPNRPVINTGPAGSGIRVFAGPRDDPFFFDFVGFNRVLADPPGEFTGQDSFAGLNVSAIVVELPIALVSGGQNRLQISGFTYAGGQSPDDPLRPRDRMGNPAVSTVLIPSELKDRYNRGLPENDEEEFGDEILASLQRFGTSPENIDVLASVAVPDTLKLNLRRPVEYPNGRALEDDVIDTLLTLILNQPTSDGVDANDRAFPDRFPYLAPPHQAP